MNPTWQAAFKEQGQARIRIAELEAGWHVENHEKSSVRRLRWPSPCLRFGRALFFSSELLHSFGWADLWWFHAISQQWYCAFLPGFLTHNRNMIYRKYVRIIYRYMKVMNVPWKSSHWILQWKYPKCGDLSSHAIAEGSYQHRGHEVSKQREGGEGSKRETGIPGRRKVI